MMAIDTISETLATMVARLAVACPGAPRSWSNARAAGTRARRGHVREKERRHARHEQQRAEEQQRDRQISEQRQVRHRRQQRAQHAGGQQRDTMRRAAQREESRLFVAGLERCRGRRAGGFQGRNGAPRSRRPRCRAQPKITSAIGSTVTDGGTPRKNPAPRSPPKTRIAATASPYPANNPSSEPAAPINAPSTISSATRRRRVSPNVRSSANCARRLTTDSACVENTSKPPVNSATSASTLRLTRYARDMRVVASARACGASTASPAGIPELSRARNVATGTPGRTRKSTRVRLPTRSNACCAAAMSMTA